MSQSEALPRWNLDGLFKGIDDHTIQSTMNDLKQRAEAFEKNHRGTLSVQNVSAQHIVDTLQDMEAVYQGLGKLGSYASLLFSADSLDPKNGAFMQGVSTFAEALSQHFLFVDLELLTLSDDIFSRLMSDPLLEQRQHYLHQLRQQKAHRLTEPEEKILGDKSLTSSQAFARLFEQELAAKRFKVEGQERDCSEAEVLSLLHDGDRDVRRRAAQSMTQGLKEELPRLSYIFNILVQDKMIDDKYRKFANPEDARHLANEISPAAVDALQKALSERFDLVQDFYTFKKQVLGLEELFDYDRYAPIASSTRHFSYDEAKQLVLDAYRNFDPRFADIAQKFFDGNWIDAGPRAGKRGGAFCSFVTPDHHPYVFLNFGGTTRDVMTMAHELGHGIHSYFARGQTYFDFHAPLTVCETASIFGELMLFESLKKILADDPQGLLGLYIGKIEEVFASTFRQISMYHFEQDLHQAIRSKGEQTSDQINALWRARQVEMFQSSVTLTSDYDCWWSYVTHFVESPFYVYAYAFGELLTLSVYDLYRKQGKDMIEKYVTFLSAGGSRPPHELVRQLGCDVNDPAFWQGGIRLIEEMIKEAKELYVK